MDWRAISEMQILGTDNDISPIAAKTIADLELDEKMYKPDFEITEKFQGFSKELVRISLLGLGVYGFLIKLGTEEKGTAQKFLMALQQHKFLAGTGVAAFALCAGCALFHGYETARCLAYQLIIARYLNRLEGDRWSPQDKDRFRDVIKEKQRCQKGVVKVGTVLLFTATTSLVVGAVLVAVCSVLVLFRG
jgi:hypothetical protein